MAYGAMKAVISKIPGNRPKEPMMLQTKSPMEAPDKETELIIDFKKGIPVGINGETLPPLDILGKLNEIGAENGIGRADLVETRLVGMKSRGSVRNSGGHLALHRFEGTGDVDPGCGNPQFQENDGY